MRVIRSLALSFGGLTVAATLLAPQAAADPDDVPPPCSGLLAAICGMVPIAPGLDHDIDLTTQVPADGLPPAPLQEDLPPADVCALGCI